MSTTQELQVQEKQEVEKAGEQTIPARTFIPPTDIFENDDNLNIIMEMPGVARDKITVDLENNVLSVEGQIDFSSYDELDPVYTEYNIGHYRRSFTLSNKINQNKIEAEVKDGVLKLILPKAEESKPRKITVN